MLISLKFMFWFPLKGPRDFQSELASKLGLTKAPPPKKKMDVDANVEGSDWDSESIQQETAKKSKEKKVAEDTKSVSSRRSTMSKSKKRADSTMSDTQSITSKKIKKKKSDSLKSKKKNKGSDDEGKSGFYF